MKKKWTIYVLIYSIFAILVIVMKGKLSYESLFSQEFCDGIEKIYFHNFDEKEYEITDETVIAELGKALYENKYKEIPENKYREGSYLFVIVSDGKEYDLGLGDNYISCWQGQYKLKEPLDDLIDKLLTSAGVR